MKIRAHAKINLFLEVLDKRQDGYHELDTVFQSVELFDELFFEKCNGGISLTVSGAAVPVNEENLVWKAYDLLRSRLPEKVGGVRVHLVKNIPPGAGLGGGSADAAGAFLGLDRLFGLGLTVDEHRELALQIGMDVPFCLSGGTALASGRGEILTPVRRCVDFQVLVVYPGFGIPTKSAYEALRIEECQDKRRSGDLVRALAGEKVDELWQMLYNRFEETLTRVYPVLKKIRYILMLGGCDAALLTGSGSAVCGYAPVDVDLAPLAALMRRRYSYSAITRPTQKGVVFDNAD
jgi:4-diphosphocytidyl-2-C-methyl-D-erythritol kinase